MKSWISNKEWTLIAEAMGWRLIPYGYDWEIMREHWVDTLMIPKELPEFTSSLAEARKTLAMLEKHRTSGLYKKAKQEVLAEIARLEGNQ